MSAEPPAHDSVADRRGALCVLLLGSTLTVMAGAILAPVLDLIRRDLDLGPTQTGLVLTVHGISLALNGPAVGRAIDRYGNTPVLAAGMIVYGVSGGVGLVSEDLILLLLSRLVFGIGAGAVFAGTTVALLDLYEGPRRDVVMGWRASAMSLGGVAWPLLGGVLGTLSWHGPFAVYLIGVPLGFAALALLPRSNGPRDGREASARGQVSRLLRSRSLLIAYAIQVLAASALYGVLIFVPLRLGELGVRNPPVIAVVTAGVSAAMAVSGLGYARLRRSIEDRTLVRAALGLWVAVLAVMYLAATPVVLALAGALFGIGMGAAVPAVTSWVADTAPLALRGTATSLLASAIFGGQLGAPLLLGPLVGTTSTRTAFLATAIAAAVGIVLMSLDRAPATTHDRSQLP